MKETLHNARGLDETRVRRAFRWVVTFRDFPEGSFQTVDGDSMMTEALTLFTKGRAEFFLDDVQRGDRVPGILSSEHDVVGQGGTFTIKYLEPTTRVCIPRNINRGKLPVVEKLTLKAGETYPFHGNYLVCLGAVQFNSPFRAEQSFKTDVPTTGTVLEDAILLKFLT